MPKAFMILWLGMLLSGKVLLPVDSGNRTDVSSIQLTHIGQFGLMRKARPNIPAHYHTGIDIMRPGNRYVAEPVYPIAEGVVISKRTDGPYANLIVEHDINGSKLWSLYEHIAGIEVKVADVVKPTKPMARFMNKDELNRYGWQFDHIHLEILKVKPQPLQPTAKHPERFFNSYSLVCYTMSDLHKYFFDPVAFIDKSATRDKSLSAIKASR